MGYILEVDVEDLKLHDSQYEILCHAAHFDTVSDLLTRSKIDIASSGIVMIPDIITEVVDLGQATSLLKFIEALEDLYGSIQEEQRFPDNRGSGIINEPLICLRMVCLFLNIPFYPIVYQ